MILFWLVCGFIGTAMLQQRGVGFFLSGCMGVLFGPVAILAALMQPKKPGKGWTKGW